MKRALLSIACLIAVVGCKRPTAGPVEDAETADRRRAVLSNLAENVIVPAYEDFRDAAVALEEKTAAWEASGSDDDRDEARLAWREAMRAWQITEAFQIGPVGAAGAVPGGMDLGDFVYSWPITNACRVDQEIVSQSYGTEEFASAAVNVRGLDALEYLLYREGKENECAPSRSINGDGSWAALEEDELDARRAAYAAAASTDVRKTADAILAAWEDEFADDLANAGDGESSFATTQEALNHLSDAMFYVELVVKDEKLAPPIGLIDCAEATCPAQREFVWSDTNLLAIGANLEGLERLYTGGEGLGFDDLLTDMGQGDVDEEIRGAVAGARKHAGEIETPMVELLASDPTPLVDLHQEVRNITTLLKTQFVGLLDLELPQQAEGDND